MDVCLNLYIFPSGKIPRPTARKPDQVNENSRKLINTLTCPEIGTNVQYARFQINDIASDAGQPVIMHFRTETHLLHATNMTQLKFTMYCVTQFPFSLFRDQNFIEKIRVRPNSLHRMAEPTSHWCSASKLI
jgi:hypothetical protein